MPSSSSFEATIPSSNVTLLLLKPVASSSSTDTAQPPCCSSIVWWQVRSLSGRIGHRSSPSSSGLYVSEKSPLRFVFRPWAFAIWKLCKIKVDLSFCCNLRPMNI
ncbi:hypothetical protein K1719_045265 [Acacia pycnantha]|nr:hypothetical protein K1719_045265 [Acacia pycnantha]